MSLPVRMLWVDGPLSALERLSITSFLRCGHPVHLYVYGDVTGIPDGVTMLDGRAILPEDRICRYGPAAGPGAGSLALFANLFRYELLHRHGGIWSDCDVVCLQSLAAATITDYVIPTEYHSASRQVLLANNCLLKVPAAAPFIAECRDIAMQADPKTVAWGELGPSLVTRLVQKHRLEPYLRTPAEFSPLGWWEFRRLVDGPPLALDGATLAVHCFNEMWRRDGLDKDVPYAAGSTFESLKRANGLRPAAPDAPGAATAP
ncbi:MAG: glycosyltransferase [Betaproteobacteria bacterium]